MKRTPIDAGALMRHVVPHPDPVKAALDADLTLPVEKERLYRTRPVTRRAEAEKKENALQGQHLPPSRVGKVPLNHWTEGWRRAGLKIYAVQHGTTVDALMAEGVADLCEKLGIKAP